MAINKGLSDRARQLLQEIENEYPKLISKKDSDNAGVEIQDGSIEVYKSKSIKFSSLKYRNFASQNKIITWGFGYLTLSAFIMGILFYGWQFYQKYEKYNVIRKAELPKLLNDIKVYEKNALQLQEDAQNTEGAIDFEIKMIPTAQAADELLINVSNIMEKSQLRIVKQEITVNKTPVSISFGLPQISRPIPDKTVFSSIPVPSSSNATDQAKKDDRNLAEKISGKKVSKKIKAKAKAKANAKKNNKKPDQTQVIKSNFNKLLTTIGSAEIKKNRSLIKNLPKEISFVSYHYQMKGQYLDYYKARSKLVKLYPYVRIPVEEIVTQKNNSDIHIRVVYDIPIINKKTTKLQKKDKN